MNLGLAEQLVASDPDRAVELIAEARRATVGALDDIRMVMSGIAPPVLGDRGLVGAVQALALDLSVRTTVASRLPGRPPGPIESAVYLAVAECLANVVKHSGAAAAWVDLGAGDGLLRVAIGDDGTGGARRGGGSGLSGIERRLEVFDGIMEVHSPHGGPTEIVLEVPCEW